MPPPDETINKKAVMRTYAMDVAAAQQASNTAQTPGTKKISSIPIPLPPTTQKTDVQKTVPPPPPPPQKAASADILKNIPTQVTPQIPDTKLPPEKPTQRIDTEQDTKENTPEIPVHLEITHRNKISKYESFFAKTWAWLTSSAKTEQLGGIEMHETLAIPSEAQPTQNSSAWQKPEVAETLQSSVNKEVMPKEQKVTKPNDTQEIIQQPEVSPIQQTHKTTPTEHPVLRTYTPLIPEQHTVRPVIAKPEPANIPQVTKPDTIANIPKEIISPTISPLHTYKMDIADTIQDTGASATSILAKQQDAAPVDNTAREKEKRILLWFVIGGATLFILSIIGTGFAYQYHVKKVAPARIAQTVPSLVQSDTTTELSYVKGNFLNALSQVANTPIQNGIIKVVYIATSTQEAGGVVERHPLPGGYLISAMRMSMPAILVNNTAIDSTVGVVGANNQTYPFFILHVASYDSAFAGMLRWESNLASDMQIIYPTPAIIKPALIATTTVGQQALPEPTEFVDETVANHNVRALRNSDGQSIIMYGFANKSILIIARNAAAFTVLLNKLNP